MKPLAQDTPLHVEKLWLAGLRDRGPLWRLRRLVGMTSFCWQAADDACRRAQPEATPLAREAWLLQERYGNDIAHRVLDLCQSRGLSREVSMTAKRELWDALLPVVEALETLRVSYVEDLGLPANLVVEIEGRLRSQHKLLGKMVGVMFPALFGCRTPSELCRVRGWDKQWPSRILGALPKRSWLKRLRRLGLEVLEPTWHHVAHKSPATQSRWQWTWVWDDSVFHKYGAHLGLVGRWWSGQHKRVLSGIDGLLLLVVVGEGRCIVPVDFAIRRPDPVGPGAPCRDKLRWAQLMLDERLAAFRRRGVELPAPMVVADTFIGCEQESPMDTG